MKYNMILFSNVIQSNLCYQQYHQKLFMNKINRFILVPFNDLQPRKKVLEILPYILRKHSCGMLIMSTRQYIFIAQELMNNGFNSVHFAIKNQKLNYDRPINLNMILYENNFTIDDNFKNNMFDYFIETYKHSPEINYMIFTNKYKQSIKININGVIELQNLPPILLKQVVKTIGHAYQKSQGY